MSWFGETFGDSLNSLKGQITKITKEVLAEDEGTAREKDESKIPAMEELEALCESKDIEIASLKAELSKLENKLEVELSKNSKDSSNFVSDDDDLNKKKLENELFELRKERDHLNLCLDELQSEHEINLNQVLSLADKYKSELDALKKECKAVKSESDEVSVNVNTSEATIDRSAEIEFLNTQIKELQKELENEKSSSSVKKEVEADNNLKEQLSKLLGELNEMKIVKENTEEVKKRVVIENEELKNKLSTIKKENTEIKIKLKLLHNEKEDLLNKCQTQELLEPILMDFKTAHAEVEQKVKNLLQLLDITPEKDVSVSEMIELVENEFHEKYIKESKNWKEAISDLELELKNLKDENTLIQEKLKISHAKEYEADKKYQQEISSLKNSLSEIKNQNQDLMHHSQTDDVKRLKQEITQCMNVILMKDKEITNYSLSLHNLEEQVKNLNDSSLKIEDELEAIKNEKKTLEQQLENMKNLNLKTHQEKTELEEKLNQITIEKTDLSKINLQLKSQTEELEKQVVEFTNNSEKFKIMQEDMQKVMSSKTELEKKLEELQKENIHLKNDCEYQKAQSIVKESSIAELMKANLNFQQGIAELQTQYNALLNSQEEIEKWKNESVTLQIQVEDIAEKKKEIENECLKLQGELDALKIKNGEIEELKITNTNLLKSCNELHQQLESKIQEEQSYITKDSELEKKNQIQAELISQIQEENNELKCRIQKFQQELKTQMLQSKSSPAPKEEIQQHRRSKSAADGDSHVLFDGQQSGTPQNEESAILKQALQQEQSKYQLLHHQFLDISSKEASARKEFERLKKHLIEVEDHYTEETVENEKIINDLKSKLVAVEEQLQNSSTLYTSLKVRDNQHLESLQSQLRMVTAQRDDFQSKLSAAEDEVQKHKASLMSLQMVLEQFQQDKEREIEQVALRYEKQLQLTDVRFKNLESEMDGLKKQLTEAKNGLKAASRLGEQLEKKSQQVSELEENQSRFNTKITELENSLAVANQANSGRVDKSLLKNLVLGYVLSPNSERKSQVLRIMASVLDFNQEERDKIGVDINKSGWLSNILHPKGEGSSSSQSLSEAFIKFLENESRPQPQLKLLPEQIQASASRTSKTNPKPTGHLPELMLPTFNSSQDSDSSVILKSVLKDS